MKYLISNPDKFFKDIANKPANLKVFVLCILFSSVLISLIPLLFIAYIPSSSQGSYSYLLSMFIVLFGIFFIYLLILNMVVAGVSHIILTKLLGGVGTFKKIMEIIGYVNGILAVGITFDIILQIITYQFNASYGIVDKISMLSYIMISIWAMLIFAKGIQYSYKLNFKKSLIIPFVIFLLIVVLNSVGYVYQFNY